MNNKYYVPRSRKCHAIPASWNGRSETDINTEKIHGSRVRKCWQHIETGGRYTGLYLEKEWSSAGKEISKRMVEEKDYISRIYAEQKKAGKELVHISRKALDENLDIYPLLKLLEIYKKIEDAWVLYDQYNVSPWFIAGDYFQEYVTKELLSHSVIPEEISTLLTPSKPSFSAEEELAIFEISLEILSNNITFDVLPEKILARIDNLVSRFFWIPFGYDGHVTYDRNHYIESIKKVIDQNDQRSIEGKISGLRTYEEKLLLSQQSIIKKYKIPSDLCRLIDTIYTLALMTDERKECQFQSHVAFHKVLRSLGIKFGVDPFVLKYVLFEEIKKYIEEPNMIREIGERRIKSTIVVYWTDGKCEILEGDEVKKITEEAIPKTVHTDLIKGQIGCKGAGAKTVGKVKVLKSSHEIGKLVQGEILVTAMTTPEFVPAMRRSLAIITDEGGITCHAAIVSRELNIPCIIGTKIATKVLKDGDNVEVDTENGVVKIIV